MKTQFQSLHTYYRQY